MRERFFIYLQKYRWNPENAVCWNMVQDNNFLPDVPRNLAKNRTNKPAIIGTNKDEWALSRLS